LHPSLKCLTHLHTTFSIHLTKLTMNVSRFHVSCIQETDYRPHFTCGGLLDFLEHCKHTVQCVNMVRLSANGIRAFPKDQQTLHVRTPSWPQSCSGNILKRNLFFGYASYINILHQYLEFATVITFQSIQDNNFIFCVCAHARPDWMVCFA
jgi:hypothetical protein